MRPSTRGFGAPARTRTHGHTHTHTHAQRTGTDLPSASAPLDPPTDTHTPRSPGPRSRLGCLSRCWPWGGCVARPPAWPHAPSHPSARASPWRRSLERASVADAVGLHPHGAPSLLIAAPGRCRASHACPPSLRAAAVPRRPDAPSVASRPACPHDERALTPSLREGVPASLHCADKQKCSRGGPTHPPCRSAPADGCGPGVPWSDPPSSSPIITLATSILVITNMPRHQSSLT